MNNMHILKLLKQIKLTEKQMKSCKHKIIIINIIAKKIYCKRCHKNLSDLEYHNFVTQKIEKNKYEITGNTKDILWIK